MSHADSQVCAAFVKNRSGDWECIEIEVHTIEAHALQWKTASVIIDWSSLTCFYHKWICCSLGSCCKPPAHSADPKPLSANDSLCSDAGTVLFGIDAQLTLSVLFEAGIIIVCSWSVSDPPWCCLS
eukprot:TRINITY_DN9108_c0_g4_i1.p1 TRINITY_DN9108_c0_g4~~TRINITY_DN9108_c0_g4_i1.p1  ORF type:complete len:126 (+),score=0.59 TRINITY_DN9108_c0_g4_i1:145-522(+)